MFKRLGTFAVLAVCLFAIVIVMGGCRRERKVDPPIVPPPDDPIQFVSVDPPDGSTIRPSATITVTFDGIPPEGLWVKGLRETSVIKTEGETVIINPIDWHRRFLTGPLVLELHWAGQVVTLNYTVVVPPPTFKEQLKGEWRITKGPLSIQVSIQDVTDELKQAGWDLLLPAAGLGKDLQFESSGKVVLIYLARYFVARPPGVPDAIGLVLTYTLKGSYEIADDSGNSATMTLSFTEWELDVWSDDGWPNVNWNLPRNLINGGPFANLLGDVLNKERVEINGDELRLGKTIAERAD